MFTKLSILIALVAWSETLAIAFDDDPTERPTRSVSSSPSPRVTFPRTGN